MRSLELEPYGRCGYTLIPLVKPERGGKRPLYSGWRKDTYPCAQTATLFEKGHNLGVRLEDTQIVIDVDPRNFEGDVDSMSALETELGISIKDESPCVCTGGGGFHFYLRKPADVPVVDSLHDYPGVEFKTYGRQVVAAGSVHASGKTYGWDIGPDLEDAPQIPERLLSLIRRPPPREVEGCGVLSPEEVTHCLSQLDPTDFQNHDLWLQVMMACHHASGGEARYEFVEWSCSDPRYIHQAWAIGRRWDSLSVKRSGSVVTAGTLFKHVLTAGGTLPKGRAEDDFEALETEGGELAGSDRLLIYMNGKHAVVNDTGRFRVYTRALDPIHGGKTWVASGRRDFEDLLSHRRVQIASKEKTEVIELARWWLAQKGRRQYDGITFNPEKESANTLNLWTGFAVEAKKGDWGLLEKLVRTTLCDGCPEMAEYTLDWAAHMVQRPSSPAEAALVFMGRKGSGKGTFGRALLSLVGRHGMQVTHREHLVGRFNRHLRDCLFLFCDEAFWAGDHKGEGVLKTLITEPTTFYEGKGLDGTTGPNRVHVLMAANASWVVPAGMDGERRYAVAKVSEETPPRDFFDAVYAQLEQGGTQALLYDLQRRDITGWHPRDNVPITRALIEQKLHSLDEIGEWWYGLLLKGVLPGARGDWDGSAVMVYQQDLHASLREFCRSLGASKRSIEMKLALALRKWAPRARQWRAVVPESEAIEKDSKGRARAYEIPPLDFCRDIFAAELGMDVEW